MPPNSRCRRSTSTSASTPSPGTTISPAGTSRRPWQELSDTHQAQIEVACRASIVDNLALAESLQFAALQELRSKGVELHRWSPGMLAAFEAAWQEVAAEQAAQDADFKRAWDSLQAFRADYKIWKDLGYLD